MSTRRARSRASAAAACMATAHSRALSWGAACSPVGSPAAPRRGRSAERRPSKPKFLKDASARAQARRGLQIDLTVAIEHHTIVPAREPGADFAIGIVFLHPVGFACERIAVATAARLLVHDQRVAWHAHRNFAGERLALVGDLDEVLRGPAGPATRQAVGPEGHAVRAQLQ